ncbi:hypothetical protein [Longimicrobium sp.]|uniref:hypothetical protein n=1 Tax=Longimicrobium sp. TaxID=2029185 RepID=UPI002E2F97A5|nr:hypothetical protein [Longimicrobium sp.]HEX6041377.1 hypothetical protein [Longimicrobium sp.]
MKTPPSPPEPFSALVERELGTPAGTGDRWIHETSRGLAGIALSGGGIRSATFNLGLLQGLERLGLTGAFDYLSTVSGGGYIGGFWTRWRARTAMDANGKPVSPPPRNGSFPATDTRTGQQAEAEPIRHLREFSNFLTPRLGLLTVDTGRAVVAAVSAILPSLVAALSLIVLVLLAWATGARLLLGDQALWTLRSLPWATASLLTFTGVLLVALLAAERMTPAELRVKAGVPYAAAVALSVVATGGAWGWITGTGVLRGFWNYSQRLPLVLYGDGADRWGPLFLPSAALAAGALALVAVRVLMSRFRRIKPESPLRTSLDRAQSRLWLFAAVWAVVAALWCLGVLATGNVFRTDLPAAGPLAAAATALAALFARVQKAISSPSSAKPSGQMMTRLKPLLPQLLSYAVIGLIVVTLVAGLVMLGRPALYAWGEGRDWVSAAGRLGLVTLGAVLVTVLALLLFNPNEVGLHAFYKGRLVRAYLGASCEPPNRSTGDVADDDPFLDALPAGDRPFHLVCCAANDLSNGGEIAGLNRGATSAVLSRAGISAGADWAEWGEDRNRRHVPTLGAAMTASGAAFNSLMGAKSIQFGPAVRFLAAALGLRLGLWIAHPRRIRAGQPPAPATRVQVGAVPVVSDAGRMAKAGAASSAFLARVREVLRPLFVGAPFYRELLGLARADGPTVHLSDGGHFENMAIYELVRRHCMFILASDCGQDGTVAFDDLGNLVRKVREDFAVDIRIDLAPLRPDPATGLARQHMVAGDIHYPNGDTGVLLLFKPTLVGSEPADVTQYRTRNPAFPHESTGDQFYDEAQWESYRRLGEHAATEAFARIAAGLAAPAKDDRAELFGRARFEWLPLPDGHADRADDVSERIAELNALLRQDDCRGLLEEVQIELAGLPADAPPAGEPTARRRARRAREQAAALDAVRHALRTLEELYTAESLERTYSHPVHLGLVNYFARWANARTVRAWWPVLRTLHAPPFVRFVERLYGLGGGAPPARVTTAFDADGYAALCWLNQHGAPADARKRRVIAYALEVDGRALQAGLLPCDVSAKRVAWEARDFYVAPGLWGVGLGTDFVARLRDAAQLPLADAAAGTPEPEWLIVRVSDGAASPQRIAADVQMYRQQGFAELTLDPRTGAVLMDGRAHPSLEFQDLPADWQKGPGRWMIGQRKLVPAPAPPAPPAAAAPPAEPVGS